MHLIKNKLKYIIPVFFYVSAVNAYSQKEMLPIKELDGKKVYYYEVNKGETLYSISRKLGISQSVIETDNPSVKSDGLKAGQILYFTIDNPSVTHKIHIVQSKETVYGIARQYGITQQQLTSWNPSVKDGIRPGQKLIVSDPNEENINENENGYIIKEGESLYKIASEHNTSVDKILEINNNLDREKYQAGTVIKLPIEQESENYIAPDENVASNAPDTNKSQYELQHIVRKGETFFSISHRYGISVDDLEKANPQVGIIREGMTLNIPQKNSFVVVDRQEENNIQLPVSYDDSLKVADNIHNAIDVSLILPLMLNTSPQTRQSQLYTEFYKGFLVAIDSLRNNRVPINIKLYDSEGSMAGLRKVLSDPALLESRVILAPDDNDQIGLLAKFGEENKIDILNLFVVNDMTYKTNTYVMQGNIPHQDMYEKAIRGIIGRYTESVPVILSRKDGQDDKQEYIRYLKSFLDSQKIPYKEIEFDGILSLDNLNGLTNDKSYIFIPTSGKQAELNCIIPGLLELDESDGFSGKIMLSGYPEWITFRGETLSNLHRLNTVVYSRFYTLPDDYLSKRVENSYSRWYGENMANYVPKQGLFGFDTAYFLVEWLTREVENGTPNMPPLNYHGVQNGFEFKTHPDISGKVNESLYLINYRPGGTVDKSIL